MLPEPHVPAARRAPRAAVAALALALALPAAAAAKPAGPADGRAQPPGAETTELVVRDGAPAGVAAVAGVALAAAAGTALVVASGTGRRVHL